MTVVDGGGGKKRRRRVAKSASTDCPSTNSFVIFIGFFHKDKDKDKDMSASNLCLPIRTTKPSDLGVFAVLKNAVTIECHLSVTTEKSSKSNIKI